MLRPTAPIVLVLALAVGTPAVAQEGASSILERLDTGAVAEQDAAVVVGIEDYAFLTDVPYAERDAEAFYSYLIYTRGVPLNRVTLLRQAPTASEMRTALHKAASQVGPDGTLWLYYAGHGAANPETSSRLLLGVDVQGKVSALTNPQYTLDLAEVDQITAESPAGHVMIVVDACYAGVGRDGESLLEGKRFAVPAHAVTARPKVTMWLATSENELAGPYEDVQHGLFTYFTVGALRGWADGWHDGRRGERDGVVTLDEAQEYVSDAVQAIAGEEQTPTHEARAELLGMGLSQGEQLEEGPDLAALVAGSSQGGKVEEDVFQLSPYQQRLQTLERVRQEQAKLLEQAASEWQQTEAFLNQPSALTVETVEAYIRHYETATVTVGDVTQPVTVPEVGPARAWLARQRGEPTAPMVDLSTASLDQLAAADPELRELLDRARAERTNDEVWGDVADMVAAAGNSAVALDLYLKAYELDVGDTEWRNAIALHGGAQRMVPLAAAYRDRNLSSDEAWGDYGDALGMAGDIDGACEAWGEALRLQPSDSEWPRKIAESCAQPVVEQPVVSSSPSDLRSRAQAAHGSDQAVAQQLQALATEPDNDERWGDLGDAVRNRGDASMALECYLRAFDAQPTDSEWHQKIRELGGIDMLISRIESVRGQLQGSDELMGDYGDALAAAGRTDDACQAYREALRMDADDSEWIRKVGDCGQAVAVGGLQVSDPSELRARAQRAHGSDAAVSQQLAALQSEPRGDERWGDLGDALVALGDGNMGLEAYVTAFLIQPTDGEWRRKVSEIGGADLLVALFEHVQSTHRLDDETMGDYGDALAEVGRTADACQAYQRALQMDDADSEWQRKVGQCSSDTLSTPNSAPSGPAVAGDGESLLARGDRAGALSAFRATMYAEPGDMTARHWVMSLGGGTAIQVLQDLTARAGANDEAWGDLGDAYLHQGMRSEALQAYRQALSLDEDDSEWTRKLAILERYRSGIEDQIIARAQVALNESPGSDERMGDLGDAYLNAGRWDDACRTYRDALRADDDDSEWMRKSGRCGSVRELKRRAASEDDDQVWGALGYAEASGGDWGGAVEAWTHAYELNPASSEWQQLLMAHGGRTRLQLIEGPARASSDDELWGDLGDAYVHVGRLSEAGPAYERALSLDSDDSEWVRKVKAFR